MQQNAGQIRQLRLDQTFLNPFTVPEEKFLSVRLRKVYGFYKGFLRFSTFFLDLPTKSAVF
jgi:hypothetical protein